MLEWNGNSSQGWVLATLSSLLCVLGCFIIFLDDAYYLLLPKAITKRFPFHLQENYAFMNGSLAFSCGCLLLTALYRLLPEAMTYLSSSDEENRANTVLVFAFMGGILTCVLFNHGMHLLTTESVVHCSHDGENKVEQVPSSELNTHRDHDHHEHSHAAHGGEHSSAHSHSSNSAHLPSHHEGHAGASDDYFGSHCPENHNGSSESDGSTGDTIVPGAAVKPSTTDTIASESQPLLNHKTSSGLMHFLTHGSTSEEPLLGECKGLSSAERCVYERTGELHYCEIPQFRKAEDDENVVGLEAAPDSELTTAAPHLHHDSEEHHHHHVNSPLSRLLLIGIQTIFAITLHKLPEGFITYITSETNPQLGISIFLSLLIHNYTEGFSMCLPLYYSFGSVKWRKLKAVGISATLGGLSQPMGAFLGYLFMGYYGEDHFDVGKLNYVFGVSMAVTSGFLVVIALSMYGSAVSFSARPNFVLLWCLVGMCTIGISTTFINH
ncbi:hypothetical protein OXX79_009532 [Metschnikowia pulcherrima]